MWYVVAGVASVLLAWQQDLITDNVLFGLVVVWGVPTLLALLLSKAFTGSFLD